MKRILTAVTVFTAAMMLNGCTKCSQERPVEPPPAVEAPAPGTPATPPPADGAMPPAEGAAPAAPAPGGDMPPAPDAPAK